MAGTTRSEVTPTSPEVDRLALALVGRGLVTREECQQCRGDDVVGAEAFLARLVKRGFLTANQARRATQELELLLNQMIPGYQLLEKLGQGGMGTVWKARQLSMDRLVAIKVLNPRLAANPEFLKRFRREAHLAARFSSNNVVQAIDVGSAGNLHYFVMEHVEGTTLRTNLEKNRTFTEGEAVDIVLQLAQALQHAHSRGLIHRDIKPANIILTSDGIAKLADLGLARETTNRAQAQAEKGMTLGTPFYMAPEQIEGREDVDSRADMYSLGATLYHMVTGQPPFPGKKVDDILAAHLTQRLTPPDQLNPKLSAGLGEVIEFLMAKDPGERYRTPADLILDLECLLREEPPKLARQHLAASALEGLAEGEEDEAFLDREVPMHWLVIVAGALGISVLLNLAQMLSR